VEIKQRINQNIKNPQPAKTPIAEIPKIREPKKKLENTYYQNAYDQKDIDWIIGSLLDRDNEVAKLKAEVENWKNQVQKSPVKDTTQIKNLLNQIQNLI
jgi:hypothetical protein